MTGFATIVSHALRPNFIQQRRPVSSKSSRHAGTSLVSISPNSLLVCGARKS
ncbi:hypothetical protein BJ508DRAFT_413531 [Ascobolus immersus RN42]|uniref:Uncharacterized protein n=1 Tax=Ascobolus immersus RN42 TaxID=1160509 RepID=A0A3N4IP01_ASCIM|nr:hypothetical protein BJ508DRAFT_413531 [Ascobolus immersus RN42]